MKRKLTILTAVILLISVLFSGCCSHVWFAATCTAPQTCQKCGETEGEALGHTWEEATCVTAKTCSTCKETEGEALGHTWEEATTEAPQTCTVCGQTEGSKINTDPRFTTAATKDIQGEWTCEVVLTGEMLGTTGYLDEVPATLHYHFKNNGDLEATVELHDQFAFLEGMKKMTMDITYFTMASQGYTKEQADAAFKQTYNMTVEEYVSESIENMDLEELFASFAADGVYYVTDGGIWMAESWLNQFESSEYTLDGDQLIIHEDTLEEGGEPLVWTRVKD